MTPVPVGFVIDLSAAPGAPPIPTPPSPPPIPAMPSAPAAPRVPSPGATAPAAPVPGSAVPGATVPGSPAPGSAVPKPGVLAPGAPGAAPSGVAALSADPDPTDATPADTDPADTGADSTSADSTSADSALAATPRGRATARQLHIFLTGYSFHDNTPPLSAIVSHPILHRAAGGTGTYRDPITVAVPGSGSTMKWKPGTRFYLPSVKRYVIVEDSGASPAPRGVDTHLDMWIGGQGGTRSATDQCMSRLTGNVSAVLNPRPGLPVMAGPVFANHTCRIPLLSRAGGALGNAGGALGKAGGALGKASRGLSRPLGR
ncbi:MAG TPA: hypothetical protein VNP03_00215 [Pseudonocardia sp.]|nr:hypothetical protein [Pseudonocardia sp.]